MANASYIACGRRKNDIVFCIVLMALSMSLSSAFMNPTVHPFTVTATRSTFIPLGDQHTPTQPTKSKTIATLLSESKIPPELRKEIYEAEARTPAAQGRQNRTIGYGVSAFFFLALGIANVVLTSMQVSGVNVEEMGYGFFANSLFFTSSKIGGYVDIIGAGLLGTMVELENRTREETAEKIWEELQRRKEQKKKTRDKKELKKIKGTMSTSKGGRKNSTKQSKRLAALAEVIVEEETMKQPQPHSTAEEEIENDKPEAKQSGIMGQLKDFYKQADTLAASQALILNKKLEEQGIVDKITDETGMKVIGKEAASKLNQNAPSSSEEMKEKGN